MKILSMSLILAVIAAGLFASRRESEAPLPPDFAAAIVRSDRVVAEPATALPRPFSSRRAHARGPWKGFTDHPAARCASPV